MEPPEVPEDTMTPEEKAIAAAEFIEKPEKWGGFVFLINIKIRHADLFTLNFLRFQVCQRKRYCLHGVRWIHLWLLRLDI
jgi:hypothetical protein